MNKTYLVTGAAGFIGSAVARRLIVSGHNVVTIDNLSTGFEENIPKGVVFVKGNCQDQNVVDSLSNYRFDAIYHIAGQSSGEISFEDPVYDLQTNTQSVLLLLQLCRKTGCKKFIYASTMSIYGDVPEVKINESFHPNPKSFYGVGKLASEHYLRIYANEFNMATASLRLFNVYGPGQNMENLKQGMVSIFVASAIQQRAIHSKGSSERYRDFVYIDDVVNSFLITEEVLKQGENLLFNVCSGKKTTIKELVDMIQRFLPFETTARFEGSTPGDQFGIFGDPGKMNNTLGYSDFTNIEDGIEKFIHSVLNKV